MTPNTMIGTNGRIHSLSGLFYPSYNLLSESNAGMKAFLKYVISPFFAALVSTAIICFGSFMLARIGLGAIVLIFIPLATSVLAFTSARLSRRNCPWSFWGGAMIGSLLIPAGLAMVDPVAVVLGFPILIIQTLMVIAGTLLAGIGTSAFVGPLPRRRKACPY